MSNDTKELCTNEIWVDNHGIVNEKFIIGFSEDIVHYIVNSGVGILRAERCKTADFIKNNHYLRDSQVCTYHLFR